ncbi:DUF2891 domain-containing protein [Hydrotalea flava]|uniref:DUF2891 domain-containing protein n=1 Tax=Hydrotalea flava TaxID=714549 RepID=UPI0020A24B33|nr:DUF2891 domain-containing protein [Hydrotalea flava]
MIPVLWVLASYSLQAQSEKPLFYLNADSSRFILTGAGAAHLAALPLRCIQQEYPNKINHVAISDSDQLQTPKQLHPAFYGCFDWHSTVHGHWMLVALLNQFPELPEAALIRKTVNENITPEHIAKEAAYFNVPLSKSFERTYGWAWLLQLQKELLQWQDADAVKWRTTLQPLCDTVVHLWMQFLPKQTYANRTGVHPNTAFGMTLALDYARATHNLAFENALIQSAKQLFLNDANAPAIWEPDGTDFLSPSLEEADLMRRVLNKPQFLQWFNRFFSKNALQHLTILPVVSDRTDLTIVHLDGLSLSRSWCMQGIAKELPAVDPRKKMLQRAAIAHLNASLPHITSGSYGGEHWLASFAVYALLQ